MNHFSTLFFTVNLAERRNNDLLIERIDSLRAAFRYVKNRKTFHINAIVIMPDHLHCVWTLPPGDADFRSAFKRRAKKSLVLKWKN